METIKLTKKDFDSNNEFIGKEEVLKHSGNLEIDNNLGYVHFRFLNISGYIFAQAGSGIKAGEGIKAGDGIEVGSGIKAGWGIEAGGGIEAGSGIKAGSGIEAGEGIEVGWGIKAGEGIEVGWGIKAGSGIEAGRGIKAGWGIEAGGGIEAGMFIKCKLLLNINLRIFAGLCLWREPKEEELLIECGRLEKGTICFGNLKEIGCLPKEEKEITCDGKVVEIEGKKYKLNLI